MANRKWLAHKKDGDHKSPSFFTLFSKIPNFPVDKSLQKWYNGLRNARRQANELQRNSKRSHQEVQD